MLVSSTYIFHLIGFRGKESRDLFFKFLHEKVGHNGGQWGAHCYSIGLFIEFSLVTKESGAQENLG
jgi:hypothetical protein